MKLLRNVAMSAMLVLAAIMIQSVDVEAAVDNCDAVYQMCQSMSGCSGGGCMTTYDDTASCREGVIAVWWECSNGTAVFGYGWCYYPPPVSC